MEAEVERVKQEFEEKQKRKKEKEKEKEKDKEKESEKDKEKEKEKKEDKKADEKVKEKVQTQRQLTKWLRIRRKQRKFRHLRKSREYLLSIEHSINSESTRRKLPRQQSETTNASKIRIFSRKFPRVHHEQTNNGDQTQITFSV